MGVSKIGPCILVLLHLSLQVLASCPRPSEIPHGCYCQGKMLRSKMWCRHLTEFPEFPRSAYNIHILDFTQCNFTSPPKFPPFTNLDVLSLAENQLIDLYGWEFGKTLKSTLGVLMLNSNFLSQVPTVIHEFTNLRELDLNGNQIEYLDWSVFRNSHNMQKLHMELNEMKNQYEPVGYVMKRLEVLRIQLPPGSKVSSLPKFPTLLTLALVGSAVSLVDSDQWFAQMPRLANLAIETRHDINTDLLENLPVFLLKDTVTHLYLPRNQLKSSPEMWSMIAAFTKLKALDLAYNDLRDIDVGKLAKLGSLSTLNLEGNVRMGPGNVNANLITGLPHLTYVNLRSMNLETIGDMNGSVKKLRSSLLLLLGSNPWRCDCHLRWLQYLVAQQRNGNEWHIDAAELTDGKLMCSELSPQGLQRAAISDITGTTLQCAAASSENTEEDAAEKKEAQRPEKKPKGKYNWRNKKWMTPKNNILNPIDIYQ